MRWIDVLDTCVEKYNKRKHSALGMSPVEASRTEHENMLLKKLYPVAKETKHKPKFRIGDLVRHYRTDKGRFERGFDPNWTRQIFVVSGVDLTYPYTYKLRELPNDVDGGREIQGSWYEDDLLKTAWKYGDPSDIDKIVEKKGKKVKVRWLGYDSRYDTWMNEADVYDV